MLYGVWALEKITVGDRRGICYQLNLNLSQWHKIISQEGRD